MPNELITSLDLSINIGFITILCYAIIKGYVAESIEYEKHTNHAHTDTQIDLDVSEVMEFVRLFTIFLFVASFLTLYFYGVSTKGTIDPIVMKMFIWAMILYLGHDIVWMVVGLLWFVGLATYTTLMEFQKPPRLY